MALTPDSVSTTVRRKARRAHDSVKSAEVDLAAAQQALQAALPRRNVEAITQAAQRALHAEEEVRKAAHELEEVDELLEGSPSGRPEGGASGEGARSLLPWLKGRVD
jgi:hypothetical protein